MAVVEKGNVVLEIKDSETQRYLDMGFNVTDGKGHILEECVPSTLGELKAAYIKHKAEIKALKDKIAELESEPKPAKTSTRKSTKKADTTEN